MAEDKIEKLMSLACCERDEAIDLLNKSGNDVLEALSMKMDIPKGRDAPKPRQLSEIQQFFKETGEEMTKLTDSISKGYTSLDQSGHLEQDEMRSPPVEMVPQSSCYSEYHPLVPELEVQIPETVCPSQSECSSDLQSNDQKSHDSGPEYLQLSPCQETVS